MRLIDVHGVPHDLTEPQVWIILAIGWLSFLAAWVMNILFYKTHPSAVDFSLKRFQEKMFIYIFGKKMDLKTWRKKRKEERNTVYEITSF